MSPEQARAPKSADARSDIWSLGVVLYELVLGERPFHGDTPVAILASLLSDTLPDLNAEQQRRMPDELMRVVLRCLERDPNARFANVAELARALLPLSTPSSQHIVERIESIAQAAQIAPPVDTPPEPSPAVRQTHGSTLISARSSLIGATSSTHALDSQTAPKPRRRLGLKVLAAFVALAAPLYWFVVRGVGAHDESQPASSAQGDRLPKPTESIRMNANQPRVTETARNPPQVAPTSEPTLPPSSAPSASSHGVPSASVHVAPSAPGHSDRNSDARSKLPRNPPATAASVPKKSFPLGPVRPSTTADPVNRPQ